MKVTMTRCDNPDCREIGQPERPDGPGDKVYLAPYGWLILKGGFIGSGPSVKIEVCSIKCVGPAVQCKVDAAADR